jgi:hypothetical protein
MRSLVAGPSTVNAIPSVAKYGNAASGTITSPEAQLFPEKRPASLPRARRFVSVSEKRMMMFMV